MAVLKRLSIGAKIGIITWLATISFAIVLTVISVNTSRNSERLSQLQNQLYPTLQHLQALSSTSSRIGEAMRTAVMIGEAEMLAGVDELQQQWTSTLSELALVNPNSADVNKLKTQMSVYYKDARGLALGMIEGTVDFASVNKTAERINSEFEILVGLERQLIDAAKLAVDDEVKLANEKSEWSLIIALSVGVVTIILVLLVGLAVGKNIAGGVQKVSESLHEIANGEGDLTVRISYDSKDELGDLVRYFNQFVEKLRVLIVKTRDNTEQLGTMAQSLSQVTATTNNNISSQSLSIEQTTHALNEMFISVKHISEHAAKASESASLASTDCNDGRQLMQVSVDTINQLAQDVEYTSNEISNLESHTNNVGSILDTIRSIAEQTNLLALNAAIEAARAGEHGRGFAVVADEVRSLASRTQVSTQEIQSVLEELQHASQSAVEAMSRGTDKTALSVSQANQTGQSLNSIGDQVNDISGLNDQIAAATQEQSVTSEQIRDYIGEIQSMAQQSVANIGELDGVSRALLEVNQQLFNEVNRFKV